MMMPDIKEVKDLKVGDETPFGVVERLERLGESSTLTVTFVKREVLHLVPTLETAVR